MTSNNNLSELRAEMLERFIEQQNIDVNSEIEAAFAEQEVTAYLQMFNARLQHLLDNGVPDKELSSSSPWSVGNCAGVRQTNKLWRTKIREML